MATHIQAELIRVSYPDLTSQLPLRPRILLVDDSVELLDVIRKVLHFQYDVDVAGHAMDGQEALEQIFLLQPDLVIMDVHMPRMDGLTAAASIAMLYPATATVLMSADDSPQLREQALHCGAKGFIFKRDFAIEIGAVLGSERRKRNVPAQA